MAFTNQTTHYGLPLPIGSDKSTWLDTNTAFAAIDAAIYQASTDAASAAGDITTIQGDITSLQSGKQNVLTFDAAPTLGSTNPVTSGGVYTAVDNLTIALNATDLRVSTLEGTMGNSDISTIGDGTVTGAINTINTALVKSIDITNIPNNGVITALLPNGAIPISAYPVSPIGGGESAEVLISYLGTDIFASYRVTSGTVSAIPSSNTIRVFYE